MCVCVDACVYMCVCVHVCMCACMHACMHACERLTAEPTYAHHYIDVYVTGAETIDVHHYSWATLYWVSSRSPSAERGCCARLAGKPGPGIWLMIMFVRRNSSIDLVTLWNDQCASILIFKFRVPRKGKAARRDSLPARWLTTMFRAERGQARAQPIDPPLSKLSEHPKQ